jgi:hypothetical protein
MDRFSFYCARCHCKRENPPAVDMKGTKLCRLCYSEGWDLKDAVIPYKSKSVAVKKELECK